MSELNHIDSVFGNDATVSWDEFINDDSEVINDNTVETEETFQKKLKNFDPQGALKEDAVEFVAKLYAENEEIFETLNPALLQPKYLHAFSMDQIGRIACDSDFQNKLLGLSDFQYKLFLDCSTASVNQGNNWVVATNSILDGIYKPQFAKLVQNIAQEDNYNAEILNEVLGCDDNYFDINDITQLQDYHKIRESICERIIKNPDDSDGLTDALKNMSSLDRVKFAKCELAYGISLSQGKLLCQKYGWAILNSDEKIKDEQKHEMLSNLTNIIKAQDIDDVVGMKNNKVTQGQTFNEIDTQLRRCFSSMYNQSFYQPKKEDLLGVEMINNISVPIYDAGVNFAMCTHVVGAFSSLDDGCKDKWNHPQKASHVFCTRLIANDALEIAKENSICYGFTDFDKDALIASAPWDMASIRFNKMFDTIGEMDKTKKMSVCEGSGARFLTLRDHINNTRTQGNETNWDRFDAEGRRKQPSYMIYIVNDSTTSEYKETEPYKNTLEAASQFGVPLVIVDRKKVIKNEHQQIDRMINQYSQKHDVKILEAIIQKFENNRTTGFSQESQPVYEREFPLLESDNHTFKSLQKIVSDLINENPQHVQAVIDILSQEAIKSSNRHNEFCEIMYAIKEKYPSVHIDLNRYLENDLGITKVPSKPKRISPYLFQSFYAKEEINKKIHMLKDRLTSKNNSQDVLEAKKEVGSQTTNFNRTSNFEAHFTRDFSIDK